MFDLTPASLAGYGWEPEQAKRILDYATEVCRLTFASSRAWANIRDATEGAVSVDTEREFTLAGLLPEGQQPEIYLPGRYMARPDLLFNTPDHSVIVNIKTSSAPAAWSKWGIQPAIVGEWWALNRLGISLAASWVFHVNKGRKMRPANSMAYYAGPLFIGYQKNGELIPTYRAGWERVWLWEKLPAAEWAATLVTKFPETTEAIYEVSGPHLPSPEQLLWWERAVIADLMGERGDNPNLYPRHFGKACVWPSNCDCFEFCWGMASLDPEASGYIKRVPNHPQEAEDE